MSREDCWWGNLVNKDSDGGMKSRMMEQAIGSLNPERIEP